MSQNGSRRNSIVTVDPAGNLRGPFGRMIIGNSPSRRELITPELWLPVVFTLRRPSSCLHNSPQVTPFPVFDGEAFIRLASHRDADEESPSEHFPNRRPDKLEERHARRDGVPGKTEDERPPRAPEQERAPGTDVHFPEEYLHAARFEDFPDVVMSADGHSPRKEKNVVRESPPGPSSGSIFSCRATIPRKRDFAPASFTSPIRAYDELFRIRPSEGVRSGRNKLVPGRKYPHVRAAGNAHDAGDPSMQGVPT